MSEEEKPVIRVTPNAVAALNAAISLAIRLVARKIPERPVLSLVASHLDEAVNAAYQLETLDPRDKRGLEFLVLPGF